MSSMIRLLLTMIPQQRNGPIREPTVDYNTPEDDGKDAADDMHSLLKGIPLSE